MKIQFHRIDTNVVVGLLVREFCCSGTDVSAKVLAMYAGTRTRPMEPQWLAAGLSQSESVLLRNNAWYYATDEAKQSYKKERNQERNERRRQESVKSQTVKMKSFLLVIIAKNISVLSQDVIH
ncbi:hypothetical protein [Anthropogastromicrobium sp.]|uniref:hypothetical protein n=1 Tax=Anthropogastromicrobium sp. TaxID=2981649 RepID=UPI00307A7E4F